MKLIIHTKYGKFESKEEPYNEQRYLQFCTSLSRIHTATYFTFDTENGEIYLTKPMIDDCIVELIK
jgi:hypothetical protein